MDPGEGVGGTGVGGTGMGAPPPSVGIADGAETSCNIRLSVSINWRVGVTTVIVQQLIMSGFSVFSHRIQDG